MNDKSSIVVPETVISVSEQSYEDLTRLIDPLRESSYYEIDILMEVLAFCSTQNL